MKPTLISQEEAAVIKRQRLQPLRDWLDQQGWSQAQLGAACGGVKQQTVCDWLDAGYVPVSRLAIVERITGIPRHLLNPEPFIALADKVDDARVFPFPPHEVAT